MTVRRLLLSFVLAASCQAQPLIASVVNAANSAQAIAPGSLISITGTGLATSTAQASGYPLPVTLGGDLVTIDGIPCPLIDVQPGQIVLQTPYEIPPGEASLAVTVGTTVSAPMNFAVMPVAPAIFQDAGGQALVTGQILNAASPGTVVTVYLTGLGTVGPPAFTGDANPLQPLSIATSSYSATIGGVNTPVLYLGLVPQSTTGLAQANVQIPNLPTGDYPLVLTVDGISSPATLLAVAADPPAQAPSLGVAPNGITFTGAAGGSNPASQTISVTSYGGTVNWSAQKTQPWLRLSQGTGNGSASISLSANISGMQGGTYTDTITFTAPGVPGSPTSVAVTLTLASQFYVAPTGTAQGDGSIGNPWDLQTALSQPKSVHPGDTIWVRAGTYGTGQDIFYGKLVGTPAAPIIVRQYPGERATINGWIQLGCCDQNPQPSQGAYIWVWGLEFANSTTDRTGGLDGPPSYGTSTISPSIDTWAPGSKLINNIIHDTKGGPGVWTEAIGAEVYGNVIYYNGYQATDHGHGHGLYTQNNTGRKLVSDNISFAQFGEGMQFYGSSTANVHNYDVTGNIILDNGIIQAGTPYGSLTQNLLFEGGSGVDGIVVTGNYLYDPPTISQGTNNFGGPFDASNGGISISANYLVDGGDGADFWFWNSLNFTNNTVYSRSIEAMLILGSTANYSIATSDNNTYYGGGAYLIGQGPSPNTTGLTFSRWQTTTGLDPHSVYNASAPTGVWSFVRPNKYEPGRAHIAIYNWDLNPVVNVDVSAALAVGAHYQVKDAENYYGAPVASGVYQGGTIAIPMTGLTVATPHGSACPIACNAPVTPPHTAPQFGAFVLLPQ